MALSNGFDEVLALAALNKRVGFQQPAATVDAIVAGDNLLTDSGRYFQDFHASITIANLRATQEYAGLTNDQFNTSLADLKRSIIMAGLNSVFVQPPVNILVDAPQKIYEQLWNVQPALITNTARFVGWRIGIAPGNFTAAPTSVVLFFDTAVTFNIYLFKESSPAAVLTFAVTTVANAVTTVSLPKEWVMRSSESETWYIGYYQADIGTAMAYTVNYGDYRCYNGINISGVEAVPTTGPSFQMWSYGQNQKNYGFNVELATYRDYTNAIVRSPHLFDNLIGYMMAAKVLEKIITSTRSNEKQRQTQEQVGLMYSELNRESSVDKPYTPGFKTQIKEEIARIRTTFFPTPAITSSMLGCEKPNYPYNGIS